MKKEDIKRYEELSKNLHSMKNGKPFKHKSSSTDYSSMVTMKPSDVTPIVVKNEVIVDKQEIVKDVITELRSLKGNERLDISNIRNGEQLSSLAQKASNGFNMNDQRWHGGGSGGGSVQDIFASIAVAGEDTITASSPTTILTLIEGTNINITTDNTTKEVTINATSGGGTVTSIATGTGLTGGIITGTGTISLDTKLAPADSLAGNALKVLRVNAGETAVEYATPTTGTITGVTATSPITSSGGTTPDISTSMSTDKLIGRATAGTGVMEEITLGTNLSFTGTTLNAVGGGSLSLEVNGTPNVDQTLLNLASGTNITLTDNGTGTVTIDASDPSPSAGNNGDIQLSDGAGTFVTVAGLNLDQTGNARGTGALDVQAFRSASTQVASGTSAVTFGRENTASGNYSNVFGRSNTAAGSSSNLFGAVNNDGTGSNNQMFGAGNIASGNNNTIIGLNNTASGYDGAVVVGIGNNTPGTDNIIYGAQNNDGGLGLVRMFGYGNVASNSNVIIIGNNITNTDGNTTEIGTLDSNKMTILGDGSIALANHTVTMSITDGSSGDVLTTDGSGNWAMQTISPPTPSLTEDQIAFGDASNLMTSSADFTWDGSTLAVTGDVSLEGTAARTYGMDRNTTAGTPGQGLTIDAGGATPGFNNQAGGDLTLKSGISTGTADSEMHFFTCPSNGNTPADNTPLERVTILGNGNVGIGTVAPSEELHVVGSIRMVDGSEQSGYVLTSDANGVGSWQATGGTVPTFVYGEVLTVTSTTFTLANVPTAGTTRLYRGGARQQEGGGFDYTMSGANGTLAVATAPGEVFLMDYNF